MKKVKKGDPFYIKKYKTGKLITTIILSLMITFIVVTMKIMFGDTSRVGIVFAILLSLPFAKYLIAFLMVKSFKSMDNEQYKQISDKLASEMVCYDIVFSKYEGMKFYNSLCVKNGWIYALVLAKDLNQNKKDYELWITNLINDGKNEYKVACFNNIDTYIKKACAAGKPNDNSLVVDKYIYNRILELGV